MDEVTTEAGRQRMPLMDLHEVAAYLRVHETTIHRLLKKRAIPAFRVGRDWRFVPEEIVRWTTDNTTGVKA